MHPINILKVIFSNIAKINIPNRHVIETHYESGKELIINLEILTTFLIGRKLTKLYELIT